MICSSCRRTLLSRFPVQTSRNAVQMRQISSAPSSAPSTPQPPQEISLPSSKTSPSAISSNTPGISQPLSTPMLPSTASASRPNKSSSTSTSIPSKSPNLVGSIPGGTLLHGIGYLKAKPTVHAKEDDEYPAWLWTLLDPAPGATSRDGKGSADVASMNKAARGKYLKKQEKLLKNLPKKIPVHEHSTDLTQPGDSAQLSLQRREEVTQSSRVARRQAIKEENFLRGL